MKFLKKKRYKILALLLVMLVAFIIFFKIKTHLTPPQVEDMSALELKREKLAEDLYKVDDSWLKKNKYGLWELYVKGNEFELGVKHGILAKELIEYQEEAFVESIKEIVPSEFYLRFLKHFVAWFNKDIDEYVPLEYQKEILGISNFASEEYDFIAPNYHRILNYHAAHDIGHTLQNLNLVACTAFGVKDSRSEDSTILVGRNMDFYTSDKFAENKIVAFYEPDSGYNFVFITWGGLIGVLSGMNNQGLTITLNAAKSNIPTSAKTPVSILARTILQYASTIDEAYAIAEKHETFVAEAFMIASAKDHKIEIIEKSTDSIGMYSRDDDQIILTNHYQGETFNKTNANMKYAKESGSLYRWERTEELLNAKEKHNYNSFAEILRDRKGKNGKDIGMGNELAVNQLIAHHSVIFKPEQLQIWISTSPYQLGEYLSYDLNKIFSDSLDFTVPVYDSNLTIPADSFLYSQEYKNYEEQRAITKTIRNNSKEKKPKVYSKEFIKNYIELNSEFYKAYYTVGEFYRAVDNKEKAMEYYGKALEKEIPRLAEKENIKEKIELIKEED